MSLGTSDSNAGWRRRAVGAISLCLLLAGTVTGTARGATYEVQSCTDASQPSTTGWVSGFRGQFSYAVNNCPSGGTLDGAFLTDAPHNDGDTGRFAFVAPTGTSLASIKGLRTADAGPNRPSGNPTAVLLADSNIVEECNRAIGCYQLGESLIDKPLNGAAAVTFGAICQGAAGCPAGNTLYRMRQIALKLNDETDPSLGQVSGDLLQLNETARNRTLVYSASDAGGGVFRQRLIVDGAPLAAETINDNGSKCAVPFHDPVPCRTSATNGSVGLDTATLSDGQHTLRLEVRDATDVNKVQTAPWTITVDNVPPTVGGVEVSGSAREGDTLTCTSTTSGQSPTATYGWLRANADGSSATLIDGATANPYTQQAADVGKKVLCRVAATDHGGTTTRDSTVTSGPFAGGVTVVTYCTGRPTGPTDDCGDFDGDQSSNRLDADDDGDGVPDAADIAPFNKSVPASATPAAPPAPADGAQGGAGGTGGAGGSGAGSGGPTSGTTTNTTNISSTNTTTTPDAGAGSALTVSDLNTINRVHNPLSERVGNGAPATQDALLAIRFAIGSGATLRTSTRTVAAYGQALRVRGSLQTPGNRPIVGARIFLVQKPLGASDAAWRLDKAATTGADGSFTLPVASSGRSRDIRVVYFPVGGSDTNRGSNPLALQVRQDASFAVSKHRLRNGQTLVFRGKVFGTLPTAGVDVRVQVRLNRSWYTFSKFTTTGSKGGRFRVSHRFTKTTTATTYRFRVLVLPRNRKLYTTGFSRHIDVRVLP